MKVWMLLENCTFDGGYYVRGLYMEKSAVIEEMKRLRPDARIIEHREGVELETDQDDDMWLNAELVEVSDG